MIPQHTGWKRLKHVTAIKGGAGFPHEEQGLFDEELPFFKVASLESTGFGSELSQAEHRISRETAKRLGAHIFRPGTVVFAKVGAALLLNRFRQLDTVACLDNNMMGLEPFDEVLLPRFLMYAMGTKDLALIANPGAVPSVNGSQIAEERIWCPALHEQERIANFLDAQTARIDALIAEKQRLLETLDEYRLSSINRAVSLGLRRSVPLVDTKDEWFSQIPAHWSFCPLNYRYEIQLGKMLDEKQITGDHLRPYLRNTDVQWGHINSEYLPLMDFQPDEILRYTVRPGDLLVCEGGDVGRAAIWEGLTNEIGYQKALHRVRPRSDSDLPKFIYYALFDSAKRGRFEGREKATIFHLTAEAFRRYRFAFPPLSEQRTIVAYLDALTAKLDTLEAHCGEHISRLREYRSSLISAAVTGQIDVGSYNLETAGA